MVDWRALLGSRRSGGAAPAAGTVTIRRFTTADQTLSEDLRVEEGAWLAERDGPRAAEGDGPWVARLFELAESEAAVDSCLLSYRAALKSANLTGKAYLEMWCRLPGRGEFFSRGLNQSITGTTAWASFEIPFRLRKGQKPDLIKLNLVIEGRGTVWIKDVALLMTPK